MEHKLVSENNSKSSISIKEEQKNVIIKIETVGTQEQIALNTKELHSFIGALLHVQSKMKGGQNVRD
jgi:hypothetical protein